MSADRFKLLGCGVAAGVVQSLHLAHDTQLVAGRHRYALDPENYCTVLYCTVLYCTVLYCTVQVRPRPGELRPRGLLPLPRHPPAVPGHPHGHLWNQSMFEIMLLINILFIDIVGNI